MYIYIGFRFRDRPDPNRVPTIIAVTNNYSPTPSAHAPIPRGISNIHQHQMPPNNYNMQQQQQMYGRQSGPALAPTRQASYPNNPSGRRPSQPGGGNPGGVNPFGDARNGDYGDGDGDDVDGDAVLAAALQASKYNI